MAHPTARRLARERVAARGRCGTPGSPRACRSCRRCGRGRARRASRTPRPRAAASGANTRDTPSRDPAGRVLVHDGPAEVAERDRLARGDERPGHGQRLAGVQPLQHARHQEGGHRSVADLAARVGGDEPLDLFAATWSRRRASSRSACRAIPAHAPEAHQPACEALARPARARSTPDQVGHGRAEIAEGRAGADVVRARRAARRRAAASARASDRSAASSGRSRDRR